MNGLPGSVVVGVFGVFNVEVTAVVRRGVLHPLFLLFPAGRAETAIHHLIRPCMGGEVALEIDWRSRFEDQHFKTALRSTLSRPFRPKLLSQ